MQRLVVLNNFDQSLFTFHQSLNYIYLTRKYKILKTDWLSLHYQLKIKLKNELL